MMEESGIWGWAGKKLEIILVKNMFSLSAKLVGFGTPVRLFHGSRLGRRNPLSQRWGGDMGRLGYRFGVGIGPRNGAMCIPLQRETVGGRPVDSACFKTCLFCSVYPFSRSINEICVTTSPVTLTLEPQSRANSWFSPTSAIPAFPPIPSTAKTRQDWPQSIRVNNISDPQHCWHFIAAIQSS